MQYRLATATLHQHTKQEPTPSTIADTSTISLDVNTACSSHVCALLNIDRCISSWKRKHVTLIPNGRMDMIAQRESTCQPDFHSSGYVRPLDRSLDHSIPCSTAHTREPVRPTIHPVLSKRKKTKIATRCKHKDVETKKHSS